MAEELEINLVELPSGTGTIADASFFHTSESGVDKKRTFAQVKTDVTDAVTPASLNLTDGSQDLSLQSLVTKKFSAAAFVVKSIAADEITIDNNFFVKLDPETGIADDLETISGGSANQFLYLKNNNPANTITIKSTDNIVLLEGDCVLNAVNDWIVLVYNSGNSTWEELYRTNTNFRLLQRFDVSNVASVDFTNLSGSYIFRGYNIIPVTNDVDVWLLVSQDNGSSFFSGATDYGWEKRAFDTAGGTSTGNDNTDVAIFLKHDIQNTTGNTFGFQMRVSALDNIGLYKYFRSETESYSSTNTHRRTEGLGVLKANTNAIDAVRFLMASGNISSGTFELWRV